MGAGTSATQMIFFITSVIIALGVVGALFLNVQSISTAATVGSKTLSQQLKTDITIINDPEIIPNSSVIYTFYVKNTGKEDLSTQYITVLIDGSLVQDGNLNKTILNGDAMWIPGDVLEINATVSIDPGSHSLRVITENGVEDSFEFRRS
ncbi:MAG: flagellar protein G [Candidatus Methanoperedens sp.]|nr:flagellar protein G [Candidatus Methanoperedens sp.]MCZ7403972.1 flagellar protein G [Candidatus Methanoperedens sp.]